MASSEATIRLLNIPFQRQEAVETAEDFTLFLIMHGEGDLRLGSRTQDVARGSVVSLGPGQTVYLRCESREDLVVGVIPAGKGAGDGAAQSANTDFPDSQSRGLVRQYLPEPGALRTLFFERSAFEFVEHYFALMYQESASGRSFSGRITQLLLAGLLLHFAREYVGTAGSGSSGSLGIVECVKRTINLHYEEALTLARLAAEQNITSQYLSALFRRETGMKLSDYLVATRIKHAKELLRDSDDLVIDIATAVGFNSTSHFDYMFHKYTGFRPLAYRKQSRSGMYGREKDSNVE